jgi:hypothetical protein
MYNHLYKSTYNLEVHIQYFSKASVFISNPYDMVSNTTENRLIQLTSIPVISADYNGFLKNIFERWPTAVDIHSGVSFSILFLFFLFIHVVESRNVPSMSLFRLTYRIIYKTSVLEIRVIVTNGVPVERATGTFAPSHREVF